MSASSNAVLPFLLGSAVGLLAIGAAAAEIVPPVVGSCNPTRSTYISSDSTGLLTGSLQYATAPQSSVAFVQRFDGCVIVHFSGVAFAPGVEASAPQILVRAVLEGTAQVATPSDVSFSGDDDEDFDGKGRAVRSMIFVFPSVKAGTYRLDVQWKSLDGQAVFLDQHSTFVRHQ